MSFARSGGYAADPGEAVPAWRRATSFGLAVVAHLLIAWLLLRLAPTIMPPPSSSGRPDSFTLLPDRSATPEATARPKAATRARAAAAPRPRSADDPTPQPPRPDTPVPPPPPPVAVRSDDPMLRYFGKKEMFEGSDVARIARRPVETADAGDADDAGGGPAGGDSVAAYGPGEGPGGKKLFNAEWFTEPTGSQLSPYVREGAPRPGWGMVACQTIPDNRVDNCRQIGESPLGSGYAAAVRKAAWQFRIRPPRVGGKAQIGAWVRIRIDYTLGEPRVR